jgi:hypothetical protein
MVDQPTTVEFDGLHGDVLRIPAAAASTAPET